MIVEPVPFMTTAPEPEIGLLMRWMLEGDRASVPLFTMSPVVVPLPNRPVSLSVGPRIVMRLSKVLAPERASVGWDTVRRVERIPYPLAVKLVATDEPVPPKSKL